MIHQRYRRTDTDRQTDDMRSQDRTLHYSASCAKTIGLILMKFGMMTVSIAIN